MDIGITLPRGADIVEFAKAVEGLGYDYLACGEHVLSHGPTRNAFVALSVAAGVTERIGLLTAVAILPLYPAALTARMALTLDHASNGRFHLGVGVGGDSPAEFEACGVPLDERGRRTDEALLIVDELLRGQPVSFTGRFATLNDARMLPTARHAPKPPVWVGGRSRAAERRAARFGDRWLPYLVSPQEYAAGLARVREHAIHLGRSANHIRPALYAFAAVHDDAPRARRELARSLSSAYHRDMSEPARRYGIAGRADDCARRLTEFAEAGVDTAVLTLMAEPADLAGMLARFADGCRPALGTGQPVGQQE